MSLVIKHKLNSYLIQVEVTVIGRSGSSSIVVKEAGVSRRHCSLHRSGDAIYVRDLGSANGTRVNGRKVPREGQRLKAGDTLSLGSTQLRVCEHSPGSTVDTAGSSRRDAYEEQHTVHGHFAAYDSRTPTGRTSAAP